MLFTAVKKLRKCSGFVIYLRHISKAVNLQQSKGTRYLKGVPLLSIADIQKGVHCTCKELDVGVEPPCINQGMCFRIFFVLNRVRVSNPQRLTYT